MPCGRVIIRTIPNGITFVTNMGCMSCVKPISNLMEWGMANGHWPRNRLMPRLTSKEISGWWRLLKIILRLFSGRWEMKPVTDRTLWLVTTGSNREMAAVLYNMNRQDAEPIRILFARCMPT